MPDDFLEAVEAVGVHQLADVGACPLVLHARLDEVDGIDGGGAGRASDRAERESVHRLQHLDQHASLIGTLEQKRDFIRSIYLHGIEVQGQITLKRFFNGQTSKLELFFGKK